MSIREMVDGALRRQIRRDDPADPRGWSRERLEGEVLRLRDLADPSTVVEARQALIGTVEWWLTDAAYKPPEVTGRSAYFRKMCDSIQHELEIYEGARDRSEQRL